MIKEFTLKNYSSFKNETTFTMEADTTNVSEYPEHYISFGDNNEILKVSSLYGPNGAGKSNLLKAFNHFKQLVFFGFKELEFNSPQAFIKSNLEEFNQFVLTNKLNNTMEFQLFTINNDYEIGYEIHYTKKDEKTSIVSYETMSYREVNSLDFTSIFKRTENGIEYYNEELSNIFNSLNIPISDKISFVSLVEGLFLKSSQTNKGIFDVLYSFYNEILNITFLGPERSFKKNDYNMKKIYSNSMIKDKVVKLLNFVGINIFDIVVEKEEEKLTSIYVIRKDDNNNKHYLNLQHESEGTITLFSL